MRLAGTSLGPYELVSLLGAGGMGEVYRARDTKLGREVAVKILPPAFMADPERLARFEREARVLASLNHPNIAAIYGVEETDATRALVLELVHGDTLEDRLRRSGQGLPISEALAIARQIADALDAAHERGIVHRDLKPSNLAIATDGVVKVLDFGLAKAGDIAPSPADLTHSPTAIGPTLDGVLLGTAPYMSPEQVRAKSVDKRTDIWAFGCVLYEMLAGRRAFAGDTATDAIAAILERQPDWSMLPADTPPAIRRLLERCLEKDPKRRLRDIGDARFDLASAPGEADAPRSSKRGAWSAAAPIATGVVAIAVLVTGWGLVRRRASDMPEWAREPATFAIEAATVPGGTASLPAPGIAVSRDGRQVAWTAAGADGINRIWLYTVSSGETRQLAGTENATLPFWSPDARSLGFFAQASLKVINLANGSINAIASLPEVSNGGTWSEQNIIVFSARYALYQIPASGGAPAVVAELDRTRQENSLRYPRFLPDGRHFLYVARSGRSQQSAAYVGSLDNTRVRLFPVTSHVEYAPPGYLLYANDGALVARTFDANTLKVGSEVMTVVRPVGANANGMNGHFDVSENGVLAYLRNSTAQKSVLRWFDRSGRALDTQGEPAVYSNVRIAPDGRRAAADIASESAVGRDVWVINPDGAAPTRVTFGGSDDWQPLWAPDGQTVGFMSYRNGVADLFVKTLSGSAPERPLLESDEQKVPGDWSPDGKFFTYWVDRTETRGDVVAVALDAPRQPIVVAQTTFNERRPRFSPDGRFIAYDSDETGQSEVYVQPFPPTGRKWQVSVGGGEEVSWPGDGRELFYVNVSGTLVALPVTMSNGGFSAGTPTPLFPVGRRAGGGASRYDVAPGGRRFLVRVMVSPQPQPLMIVLNWPARLRQ